MYTSSHNYRKTIGILYQIINYQQRSVFWQINYSLKFKYAMWGLPTDSYVYGVTMLIANRCITPARRVSSSKLLFCTLQIAFDRFWFVSENLYCWDIMHYIERLLLGHKCLLCFLYCSPDRNSMALVTITENVTALKMLKGASWLLLSIIQKWSSYII